MDSESCISIFLFFLICILTVASVLLWKKNKNYNINDINPNFVQKSTYPQKEDDKMNKVDKSFDSEESDISDEDIPGIQPLAWDSFMFDKPGTSGRISIK